MLCCSVKPHLGSFKQHIRAQYDLRLWCLMFALQRQLCIAACQPGHSALTWHHRLCSCGSCSS
jgi:hypothetical protein